MLWLSYHLEELFGLLRDGIDGTEEGDLLVEGLAGVGKEDGGDVESATVAVLDDDGVAVGIPDGVASGDVGLTKTAVGEGGGIGLALDKILTVN